MIDHIGTVHQNDPTCHICNYKFRLNYDLWLAIWDVDWPRRSQLACFCSCFIFAQILLNIVWFYY